MAAPASKPRRATYQDILDAPEHMVAEIIDGELLLSPRPRPRHGKAQGGVFAQVDGPFDRGNGGPGGWVILLEPELHFHRGPEREVLVPDIAGWRRPRLPVRPEQVGIEVAPDWVCEVLSPSTETIDRSRKTEIYAREGVGHLWFVNPVTTTLEVMRLAGGVWQLQATFAGEAMVRAEPFEAIELGLGDLWRW